MTEYYHRREYKQSVLSQDSPVKGAHNLKQARRQHRSRVKSIENAQFEKINKERIYKNIFELQSSWNEFQYHKQRDTLISTHEKSPSKYTKIIEKQSSPKANVPTPCPSKHSISVTSQIALKALHRTQIFLMSNSKQSPFTQELAKDYNCSKNKSSSKKLFSTSILSQKRSSEYVQKVFNSCIADRQLDSTPKRIPKQQHQYTSETLKRAKPAMKTVSPSPMTRNGQEQSIKYQGQSPNRNKTRKQHTQQSFFVVKPSMIGNSSIMRVPCKSSCNMEIESILLQQIDLKVR